PNAIVQNTTNGACAQPVKMYYCPADRPNAKDTHDSYWRCRGNYLVNWGSVTIPYDTSAGTPTTLMGPFGFQNNNSGNPLVYALQRIPDVTSNTLLMSESVVALQDGDQNSRGDFLNDDTTQPGTQFMTLTTPNSSTPDTIFCTDNDDPDAPCTTG